MLERAQQMTTRCRSCRTRWAHLSFSPAALFAHRSAARLSPFLSPAAGSFLTCKRIEAFPALSPSHSLGRPAGSIIRPSSPFRGVSPRLRPTPTGGHYYYTTSRLRTTVEPRLSDLRLSETPNSSEPSTLAEVMGSDKASSAWNNVCSLLAAWARICDYQQFVAGVLILHGLSVVPYVVSCAVSEALSFSGT